MNICEKLLAADPKSIEELQTTTYKSTRIARALGKSGAVAITIQEIPAERLRTLQNTMYDAKGNIIRSKNDKFCALICTDAIIDPPVKDPELIKHFGCSTPLELVNKLFGMEVYTISDKVYELCGISDELEDEIKN